MAYLSWISDEKLKQAVKDLIIAVKEGNQKAEKSFNRNVIDPFSALLSMIIFKMSAKEWHIHELKRQIDKSLSNAVGIFHQHVLAGVEGWEDLGNKNQVDLVNNKRHIIAELKNKHNTLNAAGLVILYKKLDALVNSKSSIYKGYTSYYVTIIPQNVKGKDETFFPSDNATGERCKEDIKIRIIDGKRFYNLVSGHQNALQELFEAIPKVCKDLSCEEFSEEDIKFVENIFSKAFIDPQQSNIDTKHKK